MTAPRAIEARLRPCVPPQDVARHPGDRLLYNQSAWRPTSAIVGRKHPVIADVPYVAATDQQQTRIGIGGG